MAVSALGADWVFEELGFEAVGVDEVGVGERLAGSSGDVEDGSSSATDAGGG